MKCNIQKYEKEGYITVEKNYDITLDINTVIDLKETMRKLEIGADIAKSYPNQSYLLRLS